MKRFLFLPTIILAILFGCSEVNENIDTNSGHYENSGNNAANIISKLSPGIYTINVFGEINPVTISNIKAAMINNPKAKISLDLSETTGLTSIDEKAFKNCDGLVGISIPDSVTTIGKNAFDDCDSLISVTIPDNVTSIGNYAFGYCDKLKSVTIGKGVTSIDNKVFYWCNKLASIQIDENNQTYSSYSNCIYNKDGTTLYLCAENATEVTILDSTITICDNAFNDCDSLISVTIPDNVTSIGKYAFGYCNKLTSVTIGKGVTSIGDNAFYWCSKLTSIQIDENNQTYSSNSNCIYNKDGTTLYLCPQTVTEVTILDSTITICDNAFNDCDSLTSVTIPANVTTIGKYAFGNCNKLTNITFADTTSTWYYTSRSDYTDGTAIDVTDAATNATNLTETYYNKYWYKEASSIE